MALRDDLKTWVPKLLFEVFSKPDGYVVTSADWNAMWNLNREQGDWNSDTIKDILTMLYETVLNDTNGASAIKLVIPGITATDLAGALTELDSDIVALSAVVTALDAALTAHKVSGDHDSRYYTQQQLQNGALDTRYIQTTEISDNAMDIKVQVCIITNANNGDGTFSYEIGGTPYVGVRTDAGHIFALLDGSYTPGENQIKAVINDTLQRSAASGGLIEHNSTSVEVTPHNTTGAEVTFEYYERVSGMGSGLHIGPTEPVNKYLGKLWART